jgi:hypothetical protein
VKERESHASLHSFILDLPPLPTIIDATLAVRHRVLRGQYVRAASLTMRLALTALALAAVSLFAFSFSAPMVFQGQILTLQVSLISTQVDPPLSEPLAVDNSSKYFCKHSLILCPPQHSPSNEYIVEPGSTDLLGHYDIRFYQGETVSYEERTDTLHHMIRAYLSTFRDLHIETWVAHGTLLGWWWNGQILPWDWDLDVQVSGQSLAYMAEMFNYTTHSYKSGNVERQYFLDVNPNYLERTRGDGWNIIDARWIDTRNGLFIDITGISETDPVDQPGVWSCKNEHQYSVTDIWPLRESTFEGDPALVPFAYDKVLTLEYGAKALTLTEYEG